VSLELASVPLAFIAGVLSILSPCVWPLVPIVMTSAAGKGRMGPLYLALGLSTAFALAGGILTFLLLNAGLNPDAFRWFAAGLLVIVGLTLVIKPLADWLSLRLSILSSRLNIGNHEATTSIGQFGVGMLLGLVWLPCVGPTLGAAIALASVGSWRPNVFANAAIIKYVLGWLLVLLGMMVFLGIDKILETFAVQYLPDWAISL